MQVYLPKRKTLYIASVYRPPVSSLSAAAFVSNLEVAMDNLQASSELLCVLLWATLMPVTLSGGVVRTPMRQASCLQIVLLPMALFRLWKAQPVL